MRAVTAPAQSAGSGVEDRPEAVGSAVGDRPKSVGSTAARAVVGRILASKANPRRKAADTDSPKGNNNRKGSNSIRTTKRCWPGISARPTAGRDLWSSQAHSPEKLVPQERFGF